jgi:Ca-activated chloride channel family protein
MLNGIEFDSPDLLHLLWALALQVLLLLAYWNWRKRTLRRLGSPALEKRLLQGFSGRRFWLKNVLFASGLALIALAIANPIKAVQVKGEVQSSADILIALDISNSMLAKDVSPSRLDQAKQFIQKLVETLDGERIGLIFFAGDAYPQMPLSNDYEALLMFVRNAQPDNITDQGTNIASAIGLADRVFESGGEAGRALILISDGENHEENAIPLVRALRKEGVQLFTVGVGTAGGAVIPESGRNYRRDFTGKTVRTSANDALMSALAQAGGGTASNLREVSQALLTIKSAVSRLPRATVEARAYTGYVSYFQWLLVAALLLLTTEQLLWWKGRERLS